MFWETHGCRYKPFSSSTDNRLTRVIIYSQICIDHSCAKDGDTSLTAKENWSLSHLDCYLVERALEHTRGHGNEFV